MSKKKDRYGHLKYRIKGVKGIVSKERLEAYLNENFGMSILMYEQAYEEAKRLPKKGEKLTDSLFNKLDKIKKLDTVSKRLEIDHLELIKLLNVTTAKVIFNGVVSDPKDVSFELSSFFQPKGNQPPFFFFYFNAKISKKEIIINLDEDELSSFDASFSDKYGNSGFVSSKQK